MTADTDALVTKAESFAADLTARVDGILPNALPFRALVLDSGDGPRVTVSTYDEGDPPEERPILLSVGGQVMYELIVKMKCCWDSAGQFLAVEESHAHITPRRGRNPLFRYEYDRNAYPTVPAAHIHVHGHRDEFAYGLAMADRKDRSGSGKLSVPRMADFHFPVGGHRFRPCVEDVLNMLINEFRIDARDDWQSAVADGREGWRQMQLAAAVRDDPETARRALASLGEGTGQSDSGRDRMRAF